MQYIQSAIVYKGVPIIKTEAGYYEASVYGRFFIIASKLDTVTSFIDSKNLQ